MSNALVVILVIIIVCCMIYPKHKPIHKPIHKSIPTPKSILKSVPKSASISIPKPKPVLNKKQKIYLDIVKKTKVALDRLNIPFFLSSGTCLGYFREGKFIDHDYDIDVGIFKENYSDKITKEMEKEGLTLYRTWGDLDTGLELSFMLKGTSLGKSAKIDIFVHYKDDKHVSWYSYSPSKKRLHYRVSKFDIKNVNFMGVIVGVPNPTLTYIEEHYGKDWKIPKKPFIDYKYYSDPISLVKDKKLVKK